MYEAQQVICFRQQWFCNEIEQWPSDFDKMLKKPDLSYFRQTKLDWRRAESRRKCLKQYKLSSDIDL